MRTRTIAALIMSILSLAISGCGGGGGGGTSSPPSGTQLSGVASKGPIAGGTIKVFEVISSGSSNPRANIPRYGTTAIAQGITGADGSYSLSIPTGVSSSLLVQVTGGSYLDESTGATLKVDDEYGAAGMRALLNNVPSGGALSASVTPYTEMAFEDVGQNPTDDRIRLSNGKVAAAFGLTDIVGIRPLDANKSFPASGSDDAKKYALGLAALSQYRHDFGPGSTMGQIVAALEGELAGGGLSLDTSGRLSASSNNFSGGSRNPNAELGDSALNPSAPATLQPSAPASTLIGSSAAVSVQVLKNDGSPVADGTLVTFSTSLGTLSAASAATVHGSVSFTVSSPSAGNALVTIRSGGAASASATIPFIAQPSKAIVRIGTQGALPAGTLIGGIAATVNYNGGRGLSILPGSVALSGAGIGSTLVPNTTASGQVLLGLLNVSGIALGEFATLTFDIAPGNLPTVADFSIAAGSSAIDVTTAAIPGTSATILGVSIQ